MRKYLINSSFATMDEADAKELARQWRAELRRDGADAEYEVRTCKRSVRAHGANILVCCVVCRTRTKREITRGV